MDELKCLAEYVSSFRLEDAPDSVRKAAIYCVLDTVGSALGAVHSDELPQIVEELSRWVCKDPPLAATVWGRQGKWDVFTAALLNGMAGHTLELDDAHTSSKSHLGTVTIPAAWAVAEALGDNGRGFLEAVILGYEVMARVGKSLDVTSHRKRGWHATGISGTFGAAAAAGKIYGLNPAQILNAFGLAGTQSSGLWAFLGEGSSCKKLHPARAAVNGITAAILAKSGMTGPSHILDAEDGGLYRAVADSYRMESLTENLGKSYEIQNVDKKPYPCCRSTHPAIDAALELRDKYAVDAENIKQVVVDTYDVGVLQCGFAEYPCNAIQAKFSTRFVTAAAFVKGRVTREEFLPAVLENPLVQKIAEHTDVRENAEFTARYPKRWSCRMSIIMKDGKILTKQIDDMSGSVATPLTPQQEQDKFMGLATVVFDTQRAKKLMEEILGIDRLQKLPDLTLNSNT